MLGSCGLNLWSKRTREEDRLPSNAKDAAIAMLKSILQLKRS